MDLQERQDPQVLLGCLVPQVKEDHLEGPESKENLDLPDLRASVDPEVQLDPPDQAEKMGLQDLLVPLATEDLLANQVTLYLILSALFN